jgi:hypothetical protein
MSVVKGLANRTRLKSSRSSRTRMGGIFTAAAGAVCAIAVFCVPFLGIAEANDAAVAAAHLSNGAFAILNALNARGVSKSDPAYGAVAIFAGDAQSLSNSLGSGDRAGVATAFATLASDRAAVDTAGASNPSLLSGTDWNRIKSEMTALSKQLGTSDTPPHIASAPLPAVSGTHSAAATAPVASGSVAPSDSSILIGSSSSPPKVVIESRNAEGSGIHLKGYLEGRGLRRGGIYTGSHEVRDFKVGAVAGEQRLNFDIGLENPPSNAVIRVYDVNGRMAEAPVVDAGTLASSADALSSAAAPLPSSASSSGVSGDGASGAAGVAPEIPPLSSSAPGGPSSVNHAPSVEDGVEVFRNKTGDDAGAGSANLAEIPSHGAPRPSPSKRHTIGSHLANVQIVISSATQIAVSPRTFELTGQIIGHGVSRAGIYVGGRLVKPITVEFGEDATVFDVKFVSNGAEARVRAFGIADQFVESSVNLSTAVASADPSMTAGETSMNAGGLPGTMYGNPTVGSDDGILVQIASVGPITRNLYVVSGVISGRSLSGAGLYQNGMLVQRISLNGGGLGGVLGALIPGASRNVNFNVRFNPQAGPATIRAFDSSGGYNEQPIVVAGGMNPYGGANPFGINPYGTNPYGTNPYGNPYGANPYGNPYGTNPYGGYGGTRTNPYAGGTFGAPPISPLMPPTSSW